MTIKRLLIQILLILLVGPLADARVPLGRGMKPRSVPGYDGQASLTVDYGRGLARYPLTRRALRARVGRAKLKPGHALWLSPIEKARLDARRIGAAPRIAAKEALARIVRIAQKRIPLPTSGGGSHRRLLRAEASQVARWGGVRLSEYVGRRAGECRERAFLVAGLLREAGFKSRVVPCQLFGPSGDRLASDHVYVEALAGGRWVMVDPSAPRPIEPLVYSRLNRALDSGKSKLVPVVLSNSGVIRVPYQQEAVELRLGR